jgi:hypothetical protein
MTEPNNFQPIQRDNDTNAAHRASIVATSSQLVTYAVKESGSEALSVIATRGADHTAFRIVFAIHYTDLGLEQLYAELAALSTEVERTKHIRRCLHDILRGDFNRPAVIRNEFAENDRESIWVRLGFSSRDVGLERLYAELLPIPTMFKRKSVLRRKLYDAFNPHLVTALRPAGRFAESTQHLPALATAAPDLHKTEITARPVALAALVPTLHLDHASLSNRRSAADKANAKQFGLT